MLSVIFVPKRAHMLCIKFSPKKAPMLNVKFVHKRAPMLCIKLSPKKAPLMLNMAYQNKIKKLRIIDSSHYIAHTEPICKKLQVVKLTDMFRISAWKFYYKLSNNWLPSYFNYMKPSLPVICNYYVIRNPKFHLPPIKHAFAERMIQYCLIKLLTLSGPGYLMSLKVRGGGTCAPPLISKSTNSILMTLYATLYKNCSHYRSAICFKIGLGLAEIIRCLCTKVVFL